MTLQEFFNHLQNHQIITRKTASIKEIFGGATEDDVNHHMQLKVT